MMRHITTRTISKLFAATVRIACALLLILPFAVSTSAEIYRWTDAQGKTHFSEHPPEEQVKSEEISSQLPPLNRDSSSEETKKLQQLFKDATPEEQAHQQQEKAQQQQRDQQRNLACNKAKNKLGTLRGRVYFTDDDDQEVVISEKERQQRVIRLEKEIQRHCP